MRSTTLARRLDGGTAELGWRRVECRRHALSRLGSLHARQKHVVLAAQVAQAVRARLDQCLELVIRDQDRLGRVMAGNRDRFPAEGLLENGPELVLQTS